MAAMFKRTHSRFICWFKDFSAKNRPAHRWYEHDLYTN